MVQTSERVSERTVGGMRDVANREREVRLPVRPIGGHLALGALGIPQVGEQ